jgi:hypothetical protein
MRRGPSKPKCPIPVPHCLTPSRSVAIIEWPLSAQGAEIHIRSPAATTSLAMVWSASHPPPPLAGAGAHQAGSPAL